jgi:hypothetical protein
MLIGIVLNAVVPVILYRLTKRYVGESEVTALSVAALFPVAMSVRDVVRGRTLNPVAVLVMMGIVVSLIGVALGGSARLLLIRESLFTGALGLACFGSLALPRPLMFYFGRYFVAGGNREATARFDAGWERPYFRFVNRTITAVWGVTMTLDFLLRITLVYTLPVAAVLIVSPIASGAILVGTIFWTFTYIRYANRKVRDGTVM